MNSGKSYYSAALLVLRVSLAFTFLYAGVTGIVDPNLWVGYLPTFVQVIADPVVLLGIFSVAEIILALWLLWGKALVWSAGASVLILLGITLSNTGLFVVVFRDLALAGAAVALLLLAREKKTY